MIRSLSSWILATAPANKPWRPRPSQDSGPRRNVTPDEGQRDVPDPKAECPTPKAVAAAFTSISVPSEILQLVHSIDAVRAGADVLEAAPSLPSGSECPMNSA